MWGGENNMSLKNTIKEVEEEFDYIYDYSSLHSPECCGHLHSRDCKVIKIKQFISQSITKFIKESFKETTPNNKPYRCSFNLSLEETRKNQDNFLNN